jgi:hypothetical protein
MIDFLRTRRCSLPLAVILLLVTQLAFAGQSCHAVMLAMDSGNDAPRSQQPAPAGDVSLRGDALPCCNSDVPPPSLCLVAVDATTATAIIAGSPPLHDLAPPVQSVASSDIIDRSLAAPSGPAIALGPPLPAYIVFSRFLS